MAGDLNTSEDAVWQSLIGALQTSARWHLAIKWIGIVGALVCTIGGGIDGTMLTSGKDAVTLKGFLVGLGGLSAMVSSALLLWVEWETPTLLGRVRDHIKEARNYLQERDALLALDSKRRALLELHSDVYETCERAKPNATIRTVIQTMMDAGGIHLKGSMDTDRDETWAFSVFEKVVDKDGVEEMERIAVHWADRIGEQGKPRKWRKQEGFTGWAWHDGDELIVHDVHDPIYAGKYLVPEGKRHDGDHTYYVSAAAIPIRVGVGDLIWGYVTATSNTAGRFRRDPSNVQSQNVETVRVLARLIATQVAIRGKGG
jgi:hypothetical protein